MSQHSRPLDMEPTVQYFITVKYGDNQTEIFNPHCKSTLLLKCIKQKCKCELLDHDTVIDLADDQGNVKNLSENQTLATYANDVLEPRGVYFLIKVIKSEVENEPTRYEPVISNTDKNCPGLSDRLNRSTKSQAGNRKGWANLKKRLPASSALSAISKATTKSGKKNSK
ncbi:C22orf15 [Branchiostoma lanceolatum]|uniref:C22orf15 protein n=1 Tax=Branchiostoma lanceolatum TaxID=7740 RepID=A0A8J9VED9_BRALA|nr:C22orf15 [Branchiostoma lanceolatum]